MSGVFPEAKAIYATPDFVKWGQGASKNFGFLKHLGVGVTLGLGAALTWKTWHWNSKRQIAQYYADLAKKEASEELERQAAIKAKFAELEAELLS
mmetsp:Transcript_23495/g.64784  ORF Transcript_23495/g.64784 Transcript_23495/m.64784 type:complete len:95 (+) Transcript_23495:780-1064(+)|eukprot:CAMPEP_0202350006 /NCGR_PEP_ID=MMETSP1126-20121109/7255_1 /ASSEMBLY_ACC=CAM_ASM_000457 /TAXON_ID=3047 /ORGANISM="Dunaliella tertiolecta, Strain CCMP1320" /LENGTH=94 /DNA_ID=CAMNT_0048941899 /DNA_START=821 /DNA_END=1105 /DNA_ORIENTATION=+